MKLKSPKITVFIGALALASSALAQVAIVDFGGSNAYVGASPTHILFSGYTTAGKTFNLDTAFNPATNYTTPSGKSGAFYGGASIVSTNGAGQWNTTSGLTVRNDITTPAFGGEDAIRFYPSWASTSGDGAQKFYSTIVFKKDDFLNDASSKTIFFDTSSNYSATFALGTGYQTANSRMRIVVQDGSNWYISQAIGFTGSNTVQAATNVTFASRNWFDYDPVTSLSTVGVAATPVFADIQAVGFFFELSSAASTNGGTNGSAWINDFAVTASVIPEPSSFALIGGLFALGFSGMRRRTR